MRGTVLENNGDTAIIMYERSLKETKEEFLAEMEPGNRVFPHGGVRFVKDDRAIGRLVAHGDYLHFVCEECGKTCEVNYKGDAILQILCPEHGYVGELPSWKIQGANNWPGLEESNG